MLAAKETFKLTMSSISVLALAFGFAEKKRNWKSGIAALSIYILFLFLLFYGAEKWTNTFYLVIIATHTLLMVSTSFSGRKLFER